jgi:hypothetical protein
VQLFLRADARLLARPREAESVSGRRAVELDYRKANLQTLFLNNFCGARDWMRLA